MVARRIAYAAIVTIDIERRCTLGAIITQPRYSDSGYQYARIYKTGNEIGSRESLEVFKEELDVTCVLRSTLSIISRFSARS